MSPERRLARRTTAIQERLFERQQRIGAAYSHLRLVARQRLLTPRNIPRAFLLGFFFHRATPMLRRYGPAAVQHSQGLLSRLSPLVGYLGRTLLSP